jgi:hypothetical protein
MEPLDELLFPEILASIAFSLIVVVVVSLLAILIMWRLVKLTLSNVPSWVWILLIFFIAWTTQYVITSLINP